MKNTYRIEKIDHLNYTEKDWQRFFDFWARSCALKGQPTSYDSVEELKKLNLKKIKEDGHEIYQVWKNERENGLLYFSIGYKDDLEKRFTYLNSSLNDGCLEKNLLELFFDKFISYDASSNSLAIKSKDGVNDYVADLYDAQIGSIAEHFELKVKEADIEKIDGWLAEGPNKFPNLRIAFYKVIPDDLIEEYAAVFTQLLKDMPAASELGDTTIKAESVKAYQEGGKLGNYGAYSYLIFNEANQLIAKTNVAVNYKHPQVTRQFMTGVLEKYRGRGLSKWLKAAMFKKLVADFPEMEKIKTETHPENHPSRELSKQMGYKKVGIGKGFLIDRAFVVQHLESRS